MAEPFGIAAGALQVAGAGVQLANTLYKCAKNIRDAEKDIDLVATEVKLTSSVLENLATVLKRDDIHDLCSTALRADAQAAMDGCKTAFNELNSALTSVLNTRSNGRTRISFSARARWPLNKTKMATLQTNLERLKTTLSLMLDVLNLASKQTATYVQYVVKPRTID